MNKSAIINCNCKHDFQDAAHGKNRRVATPKNTEQKKGSFVVSCTVCGRTHNLGKV